VLRTTALSLGVSTESLQKSRKLPLNFQSELHGERRSWGRAKRIFISLNYFFELLWFDCSQKGSERTERQYISLSSKEKEGLQLTDSLSGV
jgi:hypothetical protein